MKGLQGKATLSERSVNELARLYTRGTHLRGICRYAQSLSSEEIASPRIAIKEKACALLLYC